MVTDNIEIAGPPENVTLSNMAIKAINDNPAPARWVIELIGSLNFYTYK